MGSSSVPTALVAALMVSLVTACDSVTSPQDGARAAVSEPPAVAASSEPSLKASAATNQQLAALRRATASFHNFAMAEEAGYGVQITPCFEQLPDGAQGFHYGNPAFIDGTVVPLEPEVLLYEPQAGGHLRLVGVEYIVPLSFDQPDPLYGHEFHANVAAGVWALHVWNWRQNPNGMFADWNPKVTCEFAD